MLYEQDTSHKSNNPSLKRLVEPNDTDIVKKYKQSSFVLGARTIVLTRAGQAEFKRAIMFCNISNTFQVFLQYMNNEYLCTLQLQSDCEILVSRSPIFDTFADFLIFSEILV